MPRVRLQPWPGRRQLFNYDAYGNAIGFNLSTAATTLLYNAQQTDAATGLQYLRARYYSSSTGTFASLDPYAGNPTTPVGYNKYAYAQGDPANLDDLSGQSADEYNWWTGTIVHNLFARYMETKGVDYPQGKLKYVIDGAFDDGNPAGELEPDAVNTVKKRYYELKPITHPGRLHHNSPPAEDLFEVLIVPSGGEAFVLDSNLQRVIVLEQAEGRAAEAAEVRVGMPFS